MLETWKLGDFPGFYGFYYPRVFCTNCIKGELNMFKFYMAKVNSILSRRLADSEINLCYEFYTQGKSANYTAEYLR